ncbi:hypothetical protein K5D57_02350, partial [Pseudomonas cichorii]|nr:hypothetical protein [Pseudomonas cichorii]
EKTLNLAQQSLVTSLTSRGVTCAADNLLTSVLHHKHPHELLDSVVKERWVEPFVSTEARILQRPLYLSSGYFNKFQSFLCNFNHLRLDQLRVARQREANSTLSDYRVKPFFTAFSRYPEIPGACLYSYIRKQPADHLPAFVSSVFFTTSATNPQA